MAVDSPLAECLSMIGRNDQPISIDVAAEEINFVQNGAKVFDVKLSLFLGAYFSAKESLGKRQRICLPITTDVSPAPNTRRWVDSKGGARTLRIRRRSTGRSMIPSGLFVVLYIFLGTLLNAIHQQNSMIGFS